MLKHNSQDEETSSSETLMGINNKVLRKRCNGLKAWLEEMAA